MRAIIRSWFRKPGLWAAVSVLLFVVSGVATLDRYSLSWDEGLGNLFFGERYFRYFTSFNPAYLDFENANLPIHDRRLNLFDSAYKQPHEFPPVADTVSAAFMEVLAYRLGWMDPVDAFHLPKILLGGLLLWVLFRWASPRLGSFAAWIAILALGFHPRFWGDMHFNPKDIPITALFAFVLLAYLSWYERPSWRKAAAVGVLGGLALGIKANAAFLPAVILLGIWPWQRGRYPWSPAAAHLRQAWRGYGVMALTALGTYFLSWPYLYADPLGRLLAYYRFIYTQGERGGTGHWNLDPLVQALTTFPEVFLALLALGLAFALARLLRPNAPPVLRLLLAWLVVPLARAALPGAANFDGIRHFEEFLPAAALLAGYGASQVSSRLVRRRPRFQALAQAGLGAFLLLNLALIHLHYNPYQYLYYNALAGGLGGAQTRLKFPEATDYWAVSYREGLDWLNTHAEPRAIVAAPVARWNLRLTLPLWGRRDLRYVNEQVLDERLQASETVYVMFINRPDYYDGLARYCIENRDPVQQVLVDRVPVMFIYRLDGADAAGVRAYLKVEPAGGEP